MFLADPEASSKDSMVLAETSARLSPQTVVPLRWERPYDSEMGVVVLSWVLAWVSARLSLPFSVGKNGKGHGKKTPK